MVNPISYYDIAKCLVTKWKSVTKQIARSTIGLSYLTDFDDAERALKRFRTLEQLPRERAKRFASQRYLLKSDIMRFFPSIYTHSIPWALHTKSVAKARRNDQSLLGNQLDKLLRNAQDQQTTGIPIGPDTSHVIAELLLATVDEQLEARSRLNGFRYVDDYELGFSKRADAEVCGNELQSILSEYELELSAPKTRIVELPHAFDETWVTELRTAPVSRYGKSQHYQLMHLFGRAFELFHEDKTRNVLRYVISRIRNIPVDVRNWREYQGILCQCMLAEPGTTKSALDCLWKHTKAGLKVDRNLMVETLTSIISYHAPLSHDSEVCWALWTAIVLGIKLDSKIAKRIIQTEQTCIMVLFLDGVRKGVFPSKIDVTGWKRFITKEELYGRHWLLTYENATKKWFRMKQNYVKTDPRFGYLLQNGVQFYNENAAMEYKPLRKRITVYTVSE